MRLDIAGVPGIEFAVEQGVQHDFGFVAVHGIAPSAPVHAERSIVRARARRDHHCSDRHASDLGDLVIRPSR